MKLNLSILLVFLLVNAASIKSQNIDYQCNKHLYEINFYTGKLIPMYNDFPKNSAAFLSEFKFGIQTFGKKDWHKDYGFPQIGISFIHGRFGNHDVFGNSYSLIPNMTFKTGAKQSFTFSYTFGFGLSFFDKPHSQETNPQNFLIGSKLTYLAYAGFFVKKQVKKNLVFKTGLQLMHYSNAHYQLPNVGINLPVVFVGMYYYPFAKYPEKTEKLIQKHKKGLQINVRIGGGIHENGKATGPIGGGKYRVYSSYIYASKRVGRFSQVDFGLSLKYYEKNYEYIEPRNMYAENRQQINSTIGAIFMGHEFIMGHFAFYTSAGIKLFNPFENRYNSMRPHAISFSNKLKTHISSKIGVQFYLFTPESHAWNAFIGNYISANYSQADFPEICFGIVF